MKYKNLFFNIYSGLFFSLCYLLVIPFYAVATCIADFFNSEKRHKNTFWKKTKIKVGVNFFNRMG
jgi:hypothetical protein